MPRRRDLRSTCRMALASLAERPYDSRWAPRIASFLEHDISELQASWVADELRRLTPSGASPSQTILARSEVCLEIILGLLQDEARDDALESVVELLRYGRLLPLHRLHARWAFAKCTQGEEELQAFLRLCRRYRSDYPLLCAFLLFASTSWGIANPLPLLEEASCIMNQELVEGRAVDLYAAIRYSIASYTLEEEDLISALYRIDGLDSDEFQDTLFGLFINLLISREVPDRVVVALAARCHDPDRRMEILCLVDSNELD